MKKPLAAPIIFVITIWLLALPAYNVRAQAAPQLIEKLEKKYAPFLGEKGAHDYLEGLPFQIGDVSGETVELRIRGQIYQVELVALHDVQDTEAQHGQLDVLVFRDHQPLFLEKSLNEGSGWNGHPYMGDERKVLPLTREIEALAFVGEMWIPRGCRAYTAELYGIDVERRQIKQVFSDGELVCEGDPQVSGVKLVSKGVDAQGRELFAYTIIKPRRHGSVQVTRSLRFEPGQWKLVEARGALPRHKKTGQGT